MDSPHTLVSSNERRAHWSTGETQRGEGQGGRGRSRVCGLARLPLSKKRENKKPYADCVSQTAHSYNHYGRHRECAFVVHYRLGAMPMEPAPRREGRRERDADARWSWLGRGIHTVQAESAACEACARFAGRVPGPRRCLPPSLGVDLGIKDLELLLDLRKLLLQVAQRHLVRAIVRLLRAPFYLGIWGVGRWMVGRWCAHSRVRAS